MQRGNMEALLMVSRYFAIKDGGKTKIFDGKPENYTVKGIPNEVVKIENREETHGYTFTMEGDYEMRMIEERRTAALSRKTIEKYFCDNSDSGRIAGFEWRKR